MLNETQKHTLRSILIQHLEDVQELSKDSPQDALTALKTITDNEVYKDNKDNIIKWTVEDCVDNLRNILSHPYPQNVYKRNSFQVADGDPAMSYYHDENGEVKQEPSGLLGLTIQNDKTAEAVTGNDVVRYVHEMIENEREIYQVRQEEREKAKAEFEQEQKKHLQKIQQLKEDKRSSDKKLEQLTEQVNELLANIETKKKKIKKMKEDVHYSFEDIVFMNKKDIINSKSIQYYESLHNKIKNANVWFHFRYPVIGRALVYLDADPDLTRLFNDHHFDNHGNNIIDKIAEQLEKHPDLIEKVEVKYGGKTLSADILSQLKIAEVKKDNSVTKYLMNLIKYSFGKGRHPGAYQSQECENVGDGCSNNSHIENVEQNRGKSVAIRT